MVLNKYLVGLLQVVIIAVTALQAALSDNLLSLTEVFQIAALLVGAVVTIWVPLLERGWAAGLKVGGAVLGAVIATVIPFLTDGWSPSAVVIIVLAGLNALATQMGVDIRIDQAKPAVTAPETRHADEIVTLDPTAYEIARHAVG